MKNKILQLFMLFCFACFGVARATNIHIGDWESTQSSGQLPLNIVRNYSLTQQIYTHNEIGMHGTITSISFKNNSNSPFSFSNLQVFLKATNKEMFITTSDMVPVSESDKVFEGTFSGSGSGWVTITFDTPFEYDGQSNLLLCFYDPDPGIDARPQFQTTATSRNLSLAYCDDTEIPDLNNLYEYQGIKFRYKARNNIRLNITPHDNQQLTVYEGTSTSQYVPAYVYYFDEYSRSQFVIPAGQLEDMNGASINSVKFYTSSDNIPYTTNVPADVYIKEVNYTSISAFEPKASATIVYTGLLDFVNSGSGGEVTINFNSPYQYNGGNLLIGIENTEQGGFRDINFYGQDVTGASVAGANSSSLENVNPTQRNFIPKTTFNYTNSGTCNAPSYIRTASLSCDYAHIEWESVFNNGYWMEYKIGDDDWISIHDTPIGQGCGLGLYPNSNYSVRVRTECVNGGVSSWTTTHFTSPPVVDPPYNVHLQRLTHELAYITWDNDETNSSFSGHSFQYKEASSDVWNSLCPNNNCGIGTVLTNLTPGTNYNFRVRSNCSNGYQSEWTYLDFTTFAIPEDFPFTEVFGNSSTIGHWKKYTGLMRDVMNGSASLNPGGSWGFSSTSNGVFDTHAVLNIYSTNRKEWMVTPLVEIQNNCVLSFDLALTDYNGTQVPVTPGSQPDDKFAVLVSSNGGATWNVLREWNNTGSEYVYDNIATTGETVEIDLSDYYSPFYNQAYVLVAFYGESTVSNGDNNLHIDNVSIDVKPLCWELKVHDITLSNITPYSVTVSWTPTGANLYDVQCCIADDFNTMPLFDMGTSATSYTFGVDQWNGPLAPETQYYVRVAPNCPEGSYEPWSEVITFTTPEACPVPTNLTITEVTPHGVRATFEPGGDWQTRWHYMYTNTDEPPTYANGNTTIHTIYYPENWNTFQSNTHYYLWCGIECPEGSSNYLWGEPAEFTTPEACPTVNVSHEVEIEDIQPHSVSLSWEAYQGMATQWQVYYNLYPYLPYDEDYINEVAIVTDEPYVTIDGLLGDYDYHYWIRSYCGEWHGSPEWSSWSDMITAHTLVSCPMPTNLVAHTTANSATITWSPGNNETEWTVEITSEDWGDYLPYFEVDVPYITFDEEFLDGMIDDGDCYEKRFTVYVTAECGDEDGSSEAAELEFIVTDRQFFTVYDGDLTNNRIPAYIFYFDNFARSQFVIPAEDLTEMLGTPISSVTFYTSDSNVPYTTVSPADVYLKEVDYTSISAYAPKSSASIVYSGFFDIERTSDGGKMTINFSTPYTYQGGNLLIGVENTVDNGYNNIQFYGQRVNGASISGSNASSTGTIPATQQNFIPKTTFGFAPTCSPKSLPYSYGFEDAAEFDCWTMLDCVANSGIIDEAAHEGLYGFRFYYSTDPPQYLISPQFEGTSGVKVSFYYRNNSDYYYEYFQVGYSTTTKSPDAFTWGAEVTAYDQTWHLYEAFFPIGTKYVAIKLNSNDELHLFLDDFNFEPAVCTDENQCELTFELTDSYGDGWNGNAIRVVDVETGSVLATLANRNLDGISYGEETQTITLAVCEGRELRFEWLEGGWPQECSYTVTDINGNEVFSGSGGMSEPFYYTPNCTPIFIADGFWNDGSKWNIGIVPEEGSDVIIRANVVIPPGYIAYAWDVDLDGGSITIEDGGQLWHRTDNLVVTMNKYIQGYGDANNQNHYYLLAFPFNANLPVPAEMTAPGCDLYRFNELEPGAEWRNNNEEPIDVLRQLSGYLFASPNDLDLSFTSYTMKSGSYYLSDVDYYEDPDSNFNGWSLWGNFLTCNIYVYTKNDDGEYVPMEVMVYNEAGEKVMLSAGPIPPMSAYFLKLTETTTLYFLYYRDIPEGVIDSKFTVNSNGDQVQFSQGNLQYIGSASTPYWKFADNQWEILGNNGQGSTNQNVDRDLFGWGTSGYNHGAVCYQPWNTSSVYTDYWPYGSATTNLYDETGEAEWGYNAISNGGNVEHLGWRTLKRSEWTYVLTQRTTASGIRYAKAVVNDVNGLLLLPDDWDASNYSLNYTNTTGVSFTSNTISASQWSILEQFGVVFLPASGWRSGTNLNAAGEYGSYWASQEGNASNAGCINFSNTYFGSGDTTPRYYGTGVRLVFPAR